MKHIIVATILLILGLSTRGFSQENGMSEVKFSISKVFWNVKGSFDKLNYTIQFNPEDIENAKIFGRVSIADINTSEEKRDHHLQAEEWFDSADFPEIKISSSTIKALKGNQFEGLFTITMKGVSKEKNIHFKVIDEEGIRYLESEFTLSLEDYAIGGGAASYVVGNTVTVQLKLMY
ncbi:YceI family protein [Flammeovirga pectinis]|uniref:YceI family protein n=1 Tax=Flammeovirga pectinis TaxID=2494373 RepID=A0A3Q9FJG6_9BACT|nr:YceI family protein [Flammeovirga pectinis]AZQ61142.1 YceI family protein [Flammeovirga pectinis]